MYFAETRADQICEKAGEGIVLIKERQRGKLPFIAEKYFQRNRAIAGLAMPHTLPVGSSLDIQAFRLYGYRADPNFPTANMFSHNT